MDRACSGTITMDNHSLREGMRDVFGNFEDFYNTLSTSGQHMGKHGVVQATTKPLFGGKQQLSSSNTSSPSPSSTQQSATECIQRMKDLVTIQPLQLIQRPASLNRDYQTEPSSSVRSTPDSQEFARKKRKGRHADHSDSEVEKDREKRKRKRELKDEVASTSSHVRDDDQMRELFGDVDDVTKNSCDGEAKSSAVSPDSGVHSTENGDENEGHSAQSILNIITRLSPPLSPIQQRPQEKKLEKERELKEREQREKEAAKEKERKEKEEQRRKREKEKEREREKDKERKEAEKKEQEEKERRRRDRELAEKKEQEKRETERRERKEAERRIAEEKERNEKERAARRLEQEEREREQQKQKAAEEARAKAKCDSLFDDNINRLKGEISLNGLSPSKLSKLLDMGKKNGIVKPKDKEREKLKEKDDDSLSVSSGKSEKRSSEKKEKAEKERRKEEKRLEKERMREKERNKELKNELESTASPRPGSSQSFSGKEFRCACNECLPSRPIRPEKPGEGDKAEEFYQIMAKSRKRKADAETDPMSRILLYLESVVYFSLSATHIVASVDNFTHRQVSVVRDTCELLKMVTHRFTTKDQLSSLQAHFTSRIRSLSLRTQSILAFNLYNFRAASAFKAHNILENMEDKVTYTTKTEDGVEGKTPSPGSSVHSGSNQGANSMKQVTMSYDMYVCQRQQQKTLQHLMFAHRMWDDAHVQAGKSSMDTAFINSMESVCGHMCVTSKLDKMCAFLLTGVTWLRAEYELEKSRPAPAPTTSTSTTSSASTGSAPSSKR